MSLVAFRAAELTGEPKNLPEAPPIGDEIKRSVRNSNRPEQWVRRHQLINLTSVVQRQKQPCVSC